MFERFTDRARRVLVLAQEESRLLGHDYIGTEHVLLGLMHEGEGLAQNALTSVGVSLEAVRSQIEQTVGRGASSPSGHIPFTRRAKKVLEFALREALQLGHNYIGTEHVLLGLIREGEGVGVQVLGSLGVDLQVLRQRVLDLVGAQGPTRSPAAIRPSSPAVARLQARAAAAAEGGPIRSQHLLLGLLADPDSVAARVLTTLGIQRDAVEGAIEAVGVADTTDEFDDEAGARTMMLTVEPNAVAVRVTDPAIVSAFARAGTSLTSADIDLAAVWRALRNAAEKVASLDEDPGDEADPASAEA